jgi:ABC-2 type transport system permease protein
MIFIAGFIANFVYHRSVISQSVNSGGAAKSEEFKSVGVLASLMKKEWRALIREAAFAFQCIFGVVFAPIMVGFLASQTGVIDLSALKATEDISPYVASIAKSAPALMLILITIIFCSGMNIAACSAISREGKNFYITKIMPVPYDLQVKAKLYISLMISLSGSAVTALVGVIIMKIPAWQFFTILAFLCLYSYTFACFALKFDMNKPRLNWSTPTEAVKNSRSSTIPVLLNMAIGILLIGLMILLIVFLPVWLMWVILLLSACGLAWLFHSRLFKNLDAAYESIE